MLFVSLGVALAHDPPDDFEYNILSGVQTVDPVLYVFDEDVILLFSDDDSGQANGALLTHNFPPGTYRVEATTFLRRTVGTFRLTIIPKDQYSRVVSRDVQSGSCTTSLGLITGPLARTSRWQDSCVSTIQPEHFSKSFLFSTSRDVTLEIYLTSIPDPKIHPIPVSLNCGWHGTCYAVNPLSSQRTGNDLDLGAAVRTPVYAMIEHVEGLGKITLQFKEGTGRTCKTVEIHVRDYVGNLVAKLDYIHVTKHTDRVNNMEMAELPRDTILGLGTFLLGEVARAKKVRPGNQDLDCGHGLPTGGTGQRLVPNIWGPLASRHISGSSNGRQRNGGGPQQPSRPPQQGQR